MTQIEVSFDEKTIREVLLGDKGTEVLLEKVMNEVLQAEMTEHLGAEPGEQTDERRGYRNGSYERELTTRVGSLTLEVPRDRDGTFQTKLFERQERSEKALVTTLMQMVVQGVSTRRVKKITTELCGREFSRQTISNLTGKLDEQVRAWAERPLGKHPFLLADAMQLKVRRQGAVRSTTAMIVVGISEEGYREILGFKIALRETGESWKELFEDLKKRGLCGVELAVSDAHEGLEKALRACFPGCIWSRCQAHFQRNVLDKTPSDCHDQMKDLLDRLRSCDEEDDAEYLAEELDASFLKQKVRDLNRWATGWKKWIWVVALAFCFVIMLVPVATDLGESITFGGVAILVALLAIIHQWQRKKAIYEILTVMADPEYEPESLFTEI